MDREDELLFYIQDRLPEQDRKAFEARLATDQTLAAELAVLQAARRDFASETTPARDLSTGWADLEARMNAPPPAPPMAANDNQPIQLSLLQTAAVAALAVVAWQFGAVPQMNDTPGGFVPVSQESDAHVLQVVFRPDATLAEAAAFLTQFGGSMSDGPSAAGVYRVQFADLVQLESALQAARSQSSLIEFAAIE